MKYIENAWKQKTNDGNELFNQGMHDVALKEYTEALFMAEDLNTNYLETINAGIPFMRVFAISCNNIAHAYEVQGELLEAEKMLKRLIYFFLNLTSNQGVIPAEVDSELKLAYLNYAGFVKLHKINKQELVKVVDIIRKTHLNSDVLKTQVHH
jgi:tetratricopeptide (TPR) repeat protein